MVKAVNGTFYPGAKSMNSILRRLARLHWLQAGSWIFSTVPPRVVIIFKDVRGVSNPDLDCGIAGQNMVLAAHSMGLGTCWVGFCKLAFEQTRKWKKYFNIAFPYKFAASLAIGWPQGEPDGEVERQTHGIDWYENNTKETIF